MKRGLLAAFVACLPVPALAQPMAPPPAPAAATAPQAIYTRQSQFGIPFKLDQLAAPGDRPSAVQLHVSDDGGQTWRLYEQVNASASRFNFRAAHDGDYLFWVRAVDGLNQAPAQKPKPELRVVVDTLAPRIELFAQQNASGEVVVRWRMLDKNLKPESLKLEFQPKGQSGAWQAVTVPPAGPQETKIENGEASFWPGAAVDNIVLRAQVTDRSGNPAVTQTEVAAGQTFSTASNATSGAATTNNGQSWQTLDERPTTGGVRWSPDQASQAPLRPNRTEEIPPPPAIEQVAPPSSLAENIPPPSPMQSPVARPASQTTESMYSSDPQSEVVPPGQPLNAPPAANDEVMLPGVSTPSYSSPGYDEPGLPRSMSNRYDFGRLPSGERPQMVNARRFEVEYDVDAVAPGDVAKVELWGTRDYGETWSSLGADSDNRSPATIIVDRDGCWGFKIVVEAASGLGGLPPRSGDTADIWVAVDTTRPQVRVTGAEAQPTAGGGELRVEYEATDDLPADKPISIAFADNPSGPWTTIAEAQPNSGQYAWRIDRRLPDRIYLQVTATDQVGNTQSATTSNPVSLDKLRPQGRIREIRPVRDAQRPRPVTR